jgi:hypothetical protein
MTGSENQFHPCEGLNYDGLYQTLLRGATELAEKEEYELSEELAATAIGLRSELARCKIDTGGDR